MFDSHGVGRKPRTTSFKTNNQAHKNSRLVLKMGPKMGSQNGTQNGDPQWGPCLLFLINKAQNWAPKTGTKTESKNGPQNRHQKQSPRTNLSTNNEGPTMSNCPASHDRTHTHKQTAAWILSKLLEYIVSQSLDTKQTSPPTSSHFFSTTPEEYPCSLENP